MADLSPPPFVPSEVEERGNTGGAYVPRHAWDKRNAVPLQETVA